MKLKLVACGSLIAMVFASSVFAKVVPAPFIHRVVPAEGLHIKYSLAGEHPQKLTCVLENFYKGYLKYTENGVEKDTGIAYGDGYSGDQFYFSHKGPKWERTQGLDSLDQFRVDEKGYVFVKNTPYHRNKVYASCFYTAEDSK